MADLFEKEPLFLKEVQLSGFKSIENVEVTFLKGLNIIIGKNAAGKTNFLKFLNKSLSLNFAELNNFNSKLVFQNGREIVLESKRNIDIKEIFNQADLNSQIISKLHVGKKLIKDKKDKETTIKEKLKVNKVIFNSTFLCHGIPNEYLIVEKPLSFKAEKKQLSNDLSKIFRDINTPYFIRGLVIDLALEMYDIENYTNAEIKKYINKSFKGTIDSLKELLKKYSPIQDIKLSDNHNVFIEEDKQNLTVNNIFFEFKIDGNWLPFSNLSDGTRRLFYIISEVFEKQGFGRIRPSTDGTYYSVQDINRIILIEEPELGIHPHQFHKLLTFLKESSRDKQIIITTHSPQALDSVEIDELERIIIAYNTKDTGTQFRHLNESELLKAHEYVKEDFLSDYWLYSDLEK